MEQKTPKKLDILLETSQSTTPIIDASNDQKRRRYVIHRICKQTIFSHYNIRFD